MKSIPSSIGIIVDGNRRWAKEKGLPLEEAYRKAFTIPPSVFEWVQRAGIGNLILFGMSTENWHRSPEEVEIGIEMLKKEFASSNYQSLAEKGIKIKFMGTLERFPQDLQALMSNLEKREPANPSLVVYFGLSYGGRADIVQACNQFIKKSPGVPISEETLAGHLWTKGVPDPDLIIRTSGEQRLSNFTLWQGAYSELYFTPTFWPDFSEQELRSILDWYALRNRRHGK